MSPLKPKTQRSFIPDDNLEELFIRKLESSGLTPADAQASGMVALSGQQTAERKIWGSRKLPALAIPYFDAHGQPVVDNGREFTRYRALCEPENKPKKFAKYMQSQGSGVHAYFPRLATIRWPEVLADVSQNIIITEGEFKAAKGCVEGFPTIGLGGVDCFTKDEKLLPELAAIVWQGRSVFIIYDSDSATKPRVSSAQKRLAGALKGRGATVFAITLPTGLGGEKVGMDDYLVTHGVDGLRKLLDQAEPVEGTTPRPPWADKLLCGSGGPVTNLDNACIALTHAPELAGCFAFDEMKRTNVLRKFLPGQTDARALPRRVEDKDALLALRWIQRNGYLPRLGKDSVISAIDICANENSFHPVRDYLTGLKWDGTPRLEMWLSETLGAEQGEYTATLGKLFLISMIARVMQPGCKVDYVLVLEGGQGIAKSTVCRALAGEWFSDQLPDVGQDEKRVSQHLRGKWLIEISELSAIRKSDFEDIKKFLTRQTEIYTPMFGRCGEVEEPRQCCFIGTTNETAYLRDESGNRRFWPLQVEKSGKIDIARLGELRDQLFAEAFELYNSGEKWWPDRDFEQRVIAPEQSARFAGGEWDEKISEYLKEKLAASDGNECCVTTTEIAEGALMMEVSRINSETSRRIAGSLRRLGWEERRSGGRRRFVPHKNVADTSSPTDSAVVAVASADVWKRYLAEAGSELAARETLAAKKPKY